ncbi:hypothetical protein [Methylobacter psychrophilus]|uniref:hypothetical protein n=1 Tax=Methylobacter psychrophilus TaxID=96941 RepID=UPI0021D505B6|nr:hypothetical protein [Methylobacter psychrophilus]
MEVIFYELPFTDINLKINILIRSIRLATELDTSNLFVIATFWTQILLALRRGIKKINFIRGYFKPNQSDHESDHRKKKALGKIT